MLVSEALWELCLIKSVETWNERDRKEDKHELNARPFFEFAGVLASFILATMRHTHIRTWFSVLVTVNVSVAFSPPALAGRISLPDATVRHTLIGKSLRCCPARTPALRELAGLR